MPGAAACGLTIVHDHPWLKPGWAYAHSGLAGTIIDPGGAANRTSHGFYDEAGQDFHLADSTGCIDRSAPTCFAALLIVCMTWYNTSWQFSDILIEED